MDEELKVLILEDVQLDAELMEYEMRREGFSFISKRVETKEGFITELENYHPDIILVDHSLPQFDGITALEIVKKKTPDTPFIFVSGKIGDEFAVDVLKKGATDYVFKNNLSKLVPAVKRALNERSELIERRKAEDELKTAYNQMEIRIQERTRELSETNQRLLGEIAERKVVEEALRESENKNNSLLQAIPDLMFILTEDGAFVDYRTNNTIFDISPDEVIGKNIADINLPEHHLNLALNKIKKALNTDSLESFDFQIPFKSVYRDYEARVKKLNEFEVLCIVRDVTEQKQAEDKLNKSLKEKDVLLKEIHHRVKNNLQIVSSLLSLQSRYMEDPASIEIFKDSQSRIKSMALIHEKLYQTGDLTKINLSEYVNELVSDLFRSYSVNTFLVEYKIESSEILLDINTAIPCGLIINELVTNSIKHAFPNNASGEIDIKIKCKKDEFMLKVQDNGLGFPEELDLDEIKTLGLQLVTNLTRQLDGTIDLRRKGGTCFQIKFKEPRCHPAKK
ncbi:MAG TPA: histidine kinase dimerization/phosphoacceptor domain -containing protein [Methanobacterium sp.]|nr:histidine kinase dimerization/phosphoacceptor domain -containing protein [Methanobacterium sp.]